MIGIFDGVPAAGHKLGTRLAMTYNGLTLNNPADAPDDTYEVNTIVYGSAYDQSFDSDPAADGTEIGNVRRTQLLFRLDGTIRAPSMAKLFDKRVALAKAFDPALAAYKNAQPTGPIGLTPANWGVLPFDFSTPTLDTANYASGLVPSRYYARSRGGVYVPSSQQTGHAGFFSAEMVVPDPRRYWQTGSEMDDGGTLDNSLADYPSWPTIEIRMLGAGDTDYTITRTGTYSTASLVLDLSASAASRLVTVDMKNHRIYEGSTEHMDFLVSGSFWEIEPTSQTITITNDTNVDYTAILWRRAWAA